MDIDEIQEEDACENCYSRLSVDYYTPEWSDIPTQKTYSCACGLVQWSEPLTDKERNEFIELP